MDTSVSLPSRSTSPQQQSDSFPNTPSYFSIASSSIATDRTSTNFSAMRNSHSASRNATCFSKISSDTETSSESEDEISRESEGEISSASISFHSSMIDCLEKLDIDVLEEQASTEIAPRQENSKKTKKTEKQNNSEKPKRKAEQDDGSPSPTMDTRRGNLKSRILTTAKRSQLTLITFNDQSHNK